MNEQVIHKTPRPADLLPALGGPALVGAIIGMHGNHAGWLAPLQAIRDGITLPLLFLGVTAAMAPALYIATSLAGAAPPARDMGTALARGFRAAGILMLGLAGPLLFLLSTNASQILALLLGALITTTGALAGLRVIFADLFHHAPSPLMTRGVYTLWSLVSLAIGARMYFEFIAG